LKILKDLQKAAFDLGELVWLPELGIGFYPVKDQPYDESYFEKYLQMDKTKAGDYLTNYRISFCRDAEPKNTIDVGIGGGRFVREFDCYGYDINPAAVEWLESHKLFIDPFKCYAENLTFWDSLEHIHDPSNILSNCKDSVFVSMPIYDDAEHIKRSKHFRKNEHCWYFTHNGLILFMCYFGFELVRHGTGEQIYREDIHTYHFRRSNG